MSSWADGFYKRTLSPEEQKDYDRIYEGWMRYETEIDVSPGLYAAGGTNKIVQAVACDHPGIFWVDYYQYRIRRTGHPGHIQRQTLVFKYFFERQETEELRSQAESWNKRVCSQIPSESPERDKLWLLYDYLARQVTYGDCGTARAHTILGCFLPGKHISVCEGIAKGFKYLCQGIDYPCIIVLGEHDGRGLSTSGRHAWNMIARRNRCRHLDVTQELIPAKIRGQAARSGFLYTDEELRSRGYGWRQNEIPQAY